VHAHARPYQYPVQRLSGQLNKPGVLAQLTAALADAKVNIVAMTLVDS